jgi:thiol-disulfide isomerase/thioredoxin
MRAEGLRDLLPPTFEPLRAAAILVLVTVASAAFGQMPADDLFRDFQPTGDFLFELDGKVLEGAEIYISDRAASYLILAPELSSPVLINPRARSVESVHLMKVAKRGDGSIDLLADATFNHLGSFEIAGQEVLFEIKGKSAKLAPKPPLLGFHDAAELRDYKPEYDRLARDYSPSAKSLEALRGVDRDVRVLIYFGTWCPTCGRLVPRMLRVAEELDGAKIDFDYYGVPRQITSDPAAERDDIHGVPTGIVYVGGKEVARLGVQELNSPESALAKILGVG